MVTDGGPNRFGRKQDLPYGQRAEGSLVNIQQRRKLRSGKSGGMLTPEARVMVLVPKGICPRSGFIEPAAKHDLDWQTCFDTGFGITVQGIAQSDREESVQKEVLRLKADRGIQAK